MASIKQRIVTLKSWLTSVEAGIKKSKHNVKTKSKA